ncbi:MAG: hypothetical protein ACK47B_03895 [Armatimonadota bacterium]
MTTRRAVLQLLTLGTAAVSSRGLPAQPEPVGNEPLSSERDPRLGRRLSLASEGIPLARVLEALSAETGVTLRFAGRAGDERLVAFVPQATLAEVLSSIAELYRCEWVRVGGDRPSYRLQKPPLRERDEARLRHRALEEIVATLGRVLRNPRDAEGLRFKPREQWLPLYPELAPILLTRGAELVRVGFLYLPMAELPEPMRGSVLGKLAPILKDQDAQRDRAILELQDMQRQMGAPPEGLPDLKPPTVPEECLLTLDLSVDAEPRAQMGLRSPEGTWYNWLHVTGDDLRDEALELYRERRPRVPEVAGGVANAPPDGADPFGRPVEIAPPAGAPAKDWIGTLRRLSDAAGIAIYTDCYHYFQHNLPGPPRGGLATRGRGTAEQILDGLCHPQASAGTQKLLPNSFWWRRGDAAFVRSFRWLWEAETVLPDALLRRAADAVRKTGTLDPESLPELAALHAFQVHSVGQVAQHLDQWQLGIQLPARLSLPARRMLLSGGITWERLSPADQLLLTPFLAPAPPGQPPNANAKITTEVTSAPEQGGVVLRVSYWPVGVRYGRSLNLPLPGVGPAPGLEPRGLEVRLLDAAN